MEVEEILFRVVEELPFSESSIFCSPSPTALSLLSSVSFLLVECGVVHRQPWFFSQGSFGRAVLDFRKVHVS